MQSDETKPAAAGGPLERRVRPLREGEVMGAYMDFDRAADPSWTTAEYLVKFGQFVSERTAAMNPPYYERDELVLALERIAGRCDAEPAYRIARLALAGARPNVGVEPHSAAERT